MRNLGPASVELLREAGIATVAELRELGAAEAFRQVKFMFPKRVSLNMLYALNAALEDLPWRAITDRNRSEWRRAAGLEE